MVVNGKDLESQSNYPVQDGIDKRLSAHEAWLLGNDLCLSVRLFVLEIVDGRADILLKVLSDDSDNVLLLKMHYDSPGKIIIIFLGGKAHVPCASRKDGWLWPESGYSSQQAADRGGDSQKVGQMYERKARVCRLARALL